ncbi:MAG: transcription antitermination factor NusB [Akkermansia sp.]
MNQPHSSSSRQAALQCLLKWENGHAFAESLIEQIAQQANLGKSDRSLTQAIVFGVLRNKSWLDYVISTLRKGTLDQSTRILLEIGLCQTFIMQLAEHAAVFETVNLAPERVRGLINAILRSALRQKSEIIKDKETQAPFISYSMPEWMVQRWVHAYGEEDTLALLKWNNNPPSLYARRNPLIPLSDDAESLVALEGVPGWFEINGPLPIDSIRSGALYIADPSTRHAVDMLAPAEGEKILDACAAPGGKAAAIIAASAGKAKLTATDSAEHRLPTLLNNLERQGSLIPVETAQMDWTQACPPCWKSYFDAILLDVPCSNTGVIQRRVDVRWRLSPHEIERITELQLSILENAAQAVKQGGRLVYSTCSIETEEDSGLIARFLARHPDFKLDREHLALPCREKADGAYAALLIRA